MEITQQPPPAAAPESRHRAEATYSRHPGPRVTVVVPYFGALGQLRTCLAALQVQSRPPDEIIAVDNGSAADLTALQQAYPKVRWFHEPVPGSYAARNCGLREATGEVIAFTDGDCIPNPAWLEEGVGSLHSAGPTIVGGRIALLDPPGRPLNVCEIFEELFFGMSDQQRLIEVHGFAATANLFTYRSAFARAGVFDQSLKSSGDKEWVLRATARGEILAYAPSAVVSHPRRSRFRDIYRKARRIVGGRMMLLRREKGAAGKILYDLYFQSIFNPRVHLFGIRCPRLTSLGSRLKFIVMLEVMSVVALCEKIRVLVGGDARRA
jgi:glycosyltransferase involved in cell wall biosynthesis